MNEENGARLRVGSARSLVACGLNITEDRAAFFFPLSPSIETLANFLNLGVTTKTKQKNEAKRKMYSKNGTWKNESWVSFLKPPRAGEEMEREGGMSPIRSFLAMWTHFWPGYETRNRYGENNIWQRRIMMRSQMCFLFLFLFLDLSILSLLLLRGFSFTESGQLCRNIVTLINPTCIGFLPVWMALERKKIIMARTKKK